MPQPHQIADGDSEQEYRAIEATLLATARGRWFLAEHGRRARRVDSALLEDALQRLSTSLREPSALTDQVKAEIAAVRHMVTEIKAALGRPARHLSETDAATAPEPSVVQRILRTAEDVHELAWTLQGREGRDYDQRTLEQIARHVSAMYALSRYQAVETETSLGQLERLSAAEARLAGLLETIAHAGADVMPPAPADGSRD